MHLVLTWLFPTTPFSSTGTSFSSSSPFLLYSSLPPAEVAAAPSSLAPVRAGTPSPWPGALSRRARSVAEQGQAGPGCAAMTCTLRRSPWI